MQFSAHRYETMQYKRCGHSGLQLPMLSLGLWHNFGEKSAMPQQKEILRAAFDCGITHFDLANNYGPPPGSAEENFGKILADDFAAHRDELVISTKAGYTMWPGPYGNWGSRKYLLSSLDQSLKRMKLDYVDIFYSHRPDPDTPLEETMGALDSAVRQGKALYVGISNYRGEQTRRAYEILRELGTPLLIHQPRYNMFDRWIEDDLVPVLDECRIGSIVFSPLRQGLLTNKYLQGIPEGSRASDPDGFLKEKDITPEVLEKVHALNAIAESRSQSLAQMALAWCLRIPVVTTALIGVSRVSQLHDNLKALDKLDFAEDELEAIERVLS